MSAALALRADDPFFSHLRDEGGAITRKVAPIRGLANTRISGSEREAEAFPVQLKAALANT